ncbi:hypothetical protein [Bosea sp. RAC05]|uniref:hypothetical protein n=1 Tax=Bosea sp. RAC05 TaxID=1842539 RepID=UPI000857F233|nr:hypothetical protein [Bosea sp. RAC05]AOG02953.1 hypothetical protein BSY19_5246 [Bosea sp. RAC05]
MKPILNHRDPDMWKGVDSAEMWRRYSRAIDIRVSSLNVPERPNAVVVVREARSGDVSNPQGRS